MSAVPDHLTYTLALYVRGLSAPLWACARRGNGGYFWSSRRIPMQFSKADLMLFTPGQKFAAGELKAVPMDRIRISPLNHCHKEKVGINFRVVQIVCSGDLAHAPLGSIIQREYAPSLRCLHASLPECDVVTSAAVAGSTAHVEI